LLLVGSSDMVSSSSHNALLMQLFEPAELKE